MLYITENPTQEDILGWLREEPEWKTQCPRCGGPLGLSGRLSKQIPCRVCRSCAVDEASRHGEMPLSEWYISQLVRGDYDPETITFPFEDGFDPFLPPVIFEEPEKPHSPALFPKERKLGRGLAALFEDPE